MSDSTFIYTLSDPRTPDNIRYIGQTSQVLEKRLSGHIRDAKNSKGTHKIYWIRSLLKENIIPKIEPIDEVSKNEISFWEQYYISLYKHWGFNLTNSTNGGESGPIMRGENNPSKRKEVREKISKSLKGHKKTAEHKTKLAMYRGEKHHGYGKPAWNSGIKMSEEYCALFREITKGEKNSFYGKHHTVETKEKLRKLNVGKKLSEEHKQKISKSGKGKHSEPKSTEHKKNLSIAKSKTILQFSLYGKFIKEWESATVAANVLMCSRSAINMCCNRQLKTSFGFIWKFKNNNK